MSASSGIPRIGSLDPHACARADICQSDPHRAWSMTMSPDGVPGRRSWREVRRRRSTKRRVRRSKSRRRPSAAARCRRWSPRRAGRRWSPPSSSISPARASRQSALMEGWRDEPTASRSNCPSGRQRSTGATSSARGGCEGLPSLCESTRADGWRKQHWRFDESLRVPVPQE